jgi:signal transduction histidine kinase
MAAYRIIEEAASNAMEHSHARLVVVMLSSHLADGSARLDLEVSHEIPAPVTVMEGSGLARMRARARALGGQVAYTSEPGRFVVRASLPLALPDGGRWAGP